MGQQAWLLIDCGCMAWRAFHSTGQLKHMGRSTGVAYGVLRDVQLLVEKFGTSRCVFAFDSKTSLREAIYPQYKCSRKARAQSATDEERAARKACYEEIDRLHDELLPAVGYKNVFRVEGYEADDILAKVAIEKPDDVEAVIVSSDKDLWQCLRSGVVCYNPTKKTMMTTLTFMHDWLINPWYWASVKAIAGCDSDDVPGVAGVGEITAARYIAGSLKETSTKYAVIKAQSEEDRKRNLKLVVLPYPGLVLPEVKPDEFSEAALLKVQTDLGIGIRRAVPVATEHSEAGLW